MIKILKIKSHQWFFKEEAKILKIKIFMSVSLNTVIIRLSKS